MCLDLPLNAKHVLHVYSTSMSCRAPAGRQLNRFIGNNMDASEAGWADKGFPERLDNFDQN